MTARRDDARRALDAVRSAHAACREAQRRRLAVVQAAREVHGVTMESIAAELGMTRDGLYKMVSRAATVG